MSTFIFNKPALEQNMNKTITINLPKSLEQLFDKIIPRHNQSLAGDNYFPIINLEYNDSFGVEFDNNYKYNWLEEDLHKPTIVNQEDHLGNYSLIKNGKKKDFYLPLEELVQRIQKNIIHIDHIGLNLPSSQISRQEFDDLVHSLSKQFGVYQYPNNDNWYFVIPTTEAEFDTSITDFGKLRNLKFELVYDTFATVPTLQFDIQTNLPRTRLEKIFPLPYGFCFTGLGKYFRTVYLSLPSDCFLVRFDLRYGSKNYLENNIDDWKSGQWLVESGKKQ